jgi:pimeloyl-ACP methyl ester carboxylesterase
MVKPKETQLIAEHIPGATLHIFEGETHGSYVEHSNKLAPVLKDFLSTLPQ